MPESADGSTKSNLTYSKKVWIAGGILSLIVVFLLLFKTFFGILLLVLAGVLIALYFHGCAAILRRNLHWNSKVSIVVSVLVNILLLIAFFWFVGARLSDQVSELSDTLPSTIENVKDHLDNSAVGGKILNYLNASGSSEKTSKIVHAFFSGTFGVLSDIYIVFLLAIFFTASPSVYIDGMIRLLPVGAKVKTKKIFKKLTVQLKNWIKGQIIGFVFISLLTALGLFFLKMPLILTLALIAGLLNMIPNFGPLVALIPTILLSLDRGMSFILIVVAVYTFVQILQSAVEQPLIQQKMVNIPPALTIFGQLAFGILGGLWGVLLSVPILVVIMTIVDELYIKKQQAAHA